MVTFLKTLNKDGALVNVNAIQSIEISLLDSKSDPPLFELRALTQSESASLAVGTLEFCDTKMKELSYSISIIDFTPEDKSERKYTNPAEEKAPW